ncbi:MAG: AI-2E family transporter [Prosthecobacter sp.]|nr:AI-2E family transporter [Prosthecobacter sp.]
MPEPTLAPATSAAGNDFPSPLGSAGSVNFAAKLLTFCLLAALLFWGRVVAIPLALAILLSFTLKPVVRLLQRCFIPRALAVITAVTLACSILGCLAWLIGAQLASLSNDLPGYRNNIAAKVRSVRGMLKGGAVERIQGTMESLAAELNKDSSGGAAVSEAHDGGLQVQQPVQPIPVYLTTPQKLIDFEGVAALLPIVDPLTTAALVLILVVLMLLRWDDLRSRIISFSGHQNLSAATRACDDAGHRISRYLLIQMVLNGSYGLVFAVGLYFIGLPYAALWGLCAGLFRYLPYVGPVIGGALPVLFSLITSDGWVQPLWVGGLILGLELLSNNVLEPWLYGSRLGLSEVGLIMAAVAWTFLWGPVGLVLATPLTVCLVVLGQYIPAFSIFARLLSDMPVLDAHFRFYQRLLADDQMEAMDMAKKAVREEDIEATINHLLVPALALAARDQTAGLLEPEDEPRIAATLERIFEQMLAEAAKREEKEDKEKEPEQAAPSELHTVPEAKRESTISVMVWPVEPLAACASPWLKWLLRDMDCQVVTLSPETLSSEAARLAQENRPAVFCLVSLTDSSIRRERQLTKRINSLASGVPIVAARLGVTTSTVAESPNRDLTVTRTLTETGTIARPFVQQAALAD